MKGDRRRWESARSEHDRYPCPSVNYVAATPSTLDQNDEAAQRWLHFAGLLLDVVEPAFVELGKVAAEAAAVAREEVLTRLQQRQEAFLARYRDEARNARGVKPFADECVTVIYELQRLRVALPGGNVRTLLADSLQRSRNAGRVGLEDVAGSEVAAAVGRCVKTSLEVTRDKWSRLPQYAAAVPTAGALAPTEALPLGGAEQPEATPEAAATAVDRLAAVVPYEAPFGTKVLSVEDGAEGRTNVSWGGKGTGGASRAPGRGVAVGAGAATAPSARARTTFASRVRQRVLIAVVATSIAATGFLAYVVSGSIFGADEAKAPSSSSSPRTPGPSRSPSATKGTRGPDQALVPHEPSRTPSKHHGDRTTSTVVEHRTAPPPPPPTKTVTVTPSPTDGGGGGGGGGASPTGAASTPAAPGSTPAPSTSVPPTSSAPPQPTPSTSPTSSAPAGGSSSSPVAPSSSRGATTMAPSLTAGSSGGQGGGSADPLQEPAASARSSKPPSREVIIDLTPTSTASLGRSSSGSSDLVI